jgi:hypothetical protein
MHAHHTLSTQLPRHGGRRAGTEAGPSSTPRPAAVSRLAFSATLHCLTGCSIGEVLGMVTGTQLGWGTGATVAVSVVLAFLFGYALTLRPLLRGGIPWAMALRLALAADTVSIAVMEIVDNAAMLLIPGAMDAPIWAPLFWGSLLASLVLAGIAAYPVNLWLIARGRGHAVTHRH